MRYYSTNNRQHLVDLKTAVLQSLPADRGLYMPEHIVGPGLNFIDNLGSYSLAEIAFRIALPYLASDLTENAVYEIVSEAVNFEAPLIFLDKDVSILELWHGPSLAFKDFGARFMAGLMSKLIEGEDRRLSILVATSGDTGGAVAAGFYNKKHIDVYVLFPKGKVSPLQERQLTCHGGNIRAIEVNGTFDDCQSLVKRAFLDDQINQVHHLSSANSINIARLLPQSFYYFEAYKQLIISGLLEKRPLAFCVPSGNFGNLTAGLMAHRMGLPVDHFIAATNINKVVPSYLKSGNFRPKPSIQTISNAMDVGNPSNFARIHDLFNGDWKKIRAFISGFWFDDQQTREAIEAVYGGYDYTLDPHSAVGFLACNAFLHDHPEHHVTILETAHPAKFLPVIEPIVGRIDVPERLASMDEAQASKRAMENDFVEFKQYLLSC